MTTASLNYTGRKKIRQKQFNCVLEDGADYKVSVSMDKSLVKAIDKNDSIVLDIKLRAKHQRFDLEVAENQTVFPTLFKRDSKPRYRLSVVDKDASASGRIKLSSEEFFLTTKHAIPDKKRKKKVKPVTVVKVEPTPFFSPQESDELGELPWKVDVHDVGDVQVFINSRLLASFNGDYKNPILRAMVFPPMVRQIFEGLFLRTNSMDDLIGTESEKWFTWANIVLDVDAPEEQFHQEGMLSEHWASWLDELIEAFVSQRIAGTATLLTQMEEFLSD